MLFRQLAGTAPAKRGFGQGTHPDRLFVVSDRVVIGFRRLIDLEGTTTAVALVSIAVKAMLRASPMRELMKAGRIELIFALVLSEVRNGYEVFRRHVAGDASSFAKVGASGFDEPIGHRFALILIKRRNIFAAHDLGG